MPKFKVEVVSYERKFTTVIVEVPNRESLTDLRDAIVDAALNSDDWQCDFDYFEEHVEEEPIELTASDPDSTLEPHLKIT